MGTHISWVSSRLSPLPGGCAVYVLKVFPGENLHQVLALTCEFLKSTPFKFALVCGYWRSLLQVDFPQSQPWNSEAATQFSETVSLVAQSHEIPILNTFMVD
jgi:hypothetical protein